MNANQILQLPGGIIRGNVRLVERVGWRVVSGTFGLLQRARHVRQAPKPGMDDVTLARKVESEIFRSARAPKASVNVNVVDGVVWLRGEVKRPELIRSLEQKARSVPEVRGVENALHLAKTPAPTRAGTPKRQQRTRSSTRRPTPRRVGGRVTDDRTGALSPNAEPSPAEHAAAGQGRSPAPLGSSRDAGKPSAIEPAAPATEPAASEPAAPERAASEPVTSGPLPSEPLTSEPGGSEPVTTEPAANEPESEPATTGPAVREPDGERSQQPGSPGERQA